MQKTESSFLVTWNKRKWWTFCNITILNAYTYFDSMDFICIFRTNQSNETLLVIICRKVILLVKTKQFHNYTYKRGLWSSENLKLNVYNKF